MTIENGGGAVALAAALVLSGALAGCRSPAPDARPQAGSGSSAEPWSVTVWGEHFEVFPEVEALMAGETAMAHTHVTLIDGFSPLAEGVVEIVLSGPSGEQVFTADAPLRPGIFGVEIEPASPGEADLSFRIRTPEAEEEIRAGRVRVGTAAAPGGLVVAPAPRGATDAGEPLAFLKEEQWKSDLATTWVRSGRLARSAVGLARVRPPAGGEATLTSPVDGVVRAAAGAQGWPYVGLPVERGKALLRVHPHVAPGRSLPALEADLASLTAELDSAQARSARLEELLALDAVSQREVDEARVRVRSLEARQRAAGRDLRAARSSREGSGGTGGLVVRAPFGGEIARVNPTPGATVAAGEALLRLVRTDALWLEIALPPGAARRIEAEGVGGVVLTDPEQGSLRIEEGLKVVSVAPELAPETGTVTVFLEAPPTPGLPLGATLEAQLLSKEEREGIVIPSTALVDDGGVSVVYLQLSGESFARQQVEVLERQGDRVLVDRLLPGQRLVARGGDALRRSSLMAGGDAHGHVH